MKELPSVKCAQNVFFLASQTYKQKHIKGILKKKKKEKKKSGEA